MSRGGRSAEFAVCILKGEDDVDLIVAHEGGSFLSSYLAKAKKALVADNV